MYGEGNLAKYLRKFTSAHSQLLGWAGFQALRLKRVPANVRQQALLVELGYNDAQDALQRCVEFPTTSLADTLPPLLFPLPQLHNKRHTHRPAVIRDRPGSDRCRGHQAAR